MELQDPKLMSSWKVGTPLVKMTFYPGTDLFSATSNDLVILLYDAAAHRLVQKYFQAHGPGHKDVLLFAKNIRPTQPNSGPREENRKVDTFVAVTRQKPGETSTPVYVGAQNWTRSQPLRQRPVEACAARIHGQAWKERDRISSGDSRVSLQVGT